MSCEYCAVKMNDSLIKTSVYSGLNFITTKGRKKEKGQKIDSLVFEKVSKKKLYMELLVDSIIFFLIDYNYDMLVRMVGFVPPSGKIGNVCVCQIVKDLITSLTIEIYGVLMGKTFTPSVVLRQLIIMGATESLDNFIRGWMSKRVEKREMEMPHRGDDLEEYTPVYGYDLDKPVYI